MVRAVSRRAFLLAGAAALGTLLWPRSLQLGVALPIGHYFNPDADELAREAIRFDALLLPAYAAAELIARDALRQITGPPGRAHDPEGAFTVPHTVVCYPITDELFSPRAVWPRFGRLALAAALLHRGHPVNDQHPGHVKQAALDLADARPLFVRNPLAALEAGAGEVALTPMDAATASVSGAPALTLAYDWVIPRASTNPTAAESFIRAQRSSFSPHPSSFTLTPLPAKTRALYAEAWRTVLNP
jgi:hypothetical protein